MASGVSSEGMRCSGYITSMMECSVSVGVAVNNRAKVGQDLADYNVVRTSQKSDPTPLQVKPYLGAEVDTVGNCMLVPKEKRVRLMDAIQALLASRQSCSIRALESVAGQIMAMSSSFGEITSL
jgi:hypothetical protein